MKIHYPLVCAAFLTCLAACDKSGGGQGDGSGTVPFKLSEQSLAFLYDGGEKVLSVESNTSWSIQSTEPAWLSVSPASGKGNADIKVSAVANPSKEDERSAKLVCTYDKLSTSIPVTQEKNQEAAVFSITPSQITIDPAGEQFSIVVVSDALPYEITIVDSWITLVSREGDRHTGEKVVFEAGKNPHKDPRTGILSVCTENGSCIPVTVTQPNLYNQSARHHSGFRFTATWCGWCPYMDEAFQAVAQEREDFDYVTLHSSKGYPLYFAGGAPYMTAYGVTGFPTGIVNGWKSISNSSDISVTAQNVISAMDKFDDEFPCMSDILFTSGIEDGAVWVDAQITNSVDGDLQVAAILMESGIVETQERFGTNAGTYQDYVHDHIARALLSESAFGDACTAEEGKPVSFHWSVALDNNWNADNLSVYVGVFRPYADFSGAKAQKSFPDTYIDNCRVAPVGETVNE